MDVDQPPAKQPRVIRPPAPTRAPRPSLNRPPPVAPDSAEAPLAPFPSEPTADGPRVPPARPRAPSSPPAPPAPADPAGPARSRSVPWWPFLLAAVPLSSLLGLLRAMLAGQGDAFAQAWSANLWSDVLFVAGTMGAVWVSAFIATGKGHPTAMGFVLAAGAAFVLHALVYCVSWPLTGLVDLVSGNPAPRFLSFQFATGNQSIFDLLLAGLPGLAAMTFYGPLLGLFAPAGSATGKAAADEA